MDKNDGSMEVEFEGAELEVLVVDDTPPEDRNRKPLAKDALAVDDEAAQYSAGVKKRMGELRRQAHEERREKEAAARERDEAVAFARKVAAEAGILKQKITHGEAYIADEMKGKAETRIELANKKYKEAYESGDADALAKANTELTDAMIARNNAESWQNRAKQQVNALQNEKDDVFLAQPRQEAPTQPKVDRRAAEWASGNSEWFGVDPVMTSTAYGVHEKLLNEGIHPEEDADEYYEKINSEMRRRFPEYSWSDDDDDTPVVSTEQRTPSQAQQKPPAAKKHTTVAPVTRTSGGKSKVVLTKTQVSLAERLGLTPEQYARELIKMNGA